MVTTLLNSMMEVWHFTRSQPLDGDGANGQFGEPPCYAPATYKGKTLDVIGNAGQPGNWYGIVTDTGEKTDTPIVQNNSDPCPGRTFRPPLYI